MASGVAMKNAVTSRDFREDILEAALPDDHPQTDSLDLVTGSTTIDESFSNSLNLLFDTPSYPDISSIPIYDVCYAGNCSCVHLIGGFPSQLKPCRASPFLLGPSSLTSVSEDDGLFLWQGLVNGFNICSVSGYNKGETNRFNLDVSLYSAS